MPTVLRPSIRQALPNPTVHPPKTVIWSPSVRQIERVLSDSPDMKYDYDDPTFGRSCAFCHHNRQSGSWLPDLSILEEDYFQYLPDAVQDKYMDEAYKESWFDLNCEDHGGGDAIDLD